MADAVKVELTGNTEARVGAIFRYLLAVYGDVVHPAVPDAGAVVQRAAAGLNGSERFSSGGFAAGSGGHRLSVGGRTVPTCPSPSGQVHSVPSAVR
ncbi:MAG: hypothetical protein M3357_04375 [Actinomycetota bacterium]|nr:hypothetical protein [Actinomycetota bacterium]